MNFPQEKEAQEAWLDGLEDAARPTPLGLISELRRLPEQTHKIDWWSGGNGNLYGDYNGCRYCIARAKSGRYIVARNGIEIARAPSVADAKLFVNKIVFKETK